MRDQALCRQFEILIEAMRDVNVFSVIKYKVLFSAIGKPFRSVRKNRDRLESLSTSAEGFPLGKNFPLRPLLLLRVAIALSLIGFIFSRVGWQPVVQSFSDLAPIL